MKTKIKINSTYRVTETTVTYNATNCDADVLLWIVNSDGSILIKKPHHKKAKSQICELTIEAKNISEIAFKLENQTGILCEKSNLRKVYTHKNINNQNDTFDVYFLTINLDKEHKEVVEDRFEGKFIDYREVLNHLGEETVSTECKEALLNLISLLYEKYSYL